MEEKVKDIDKWKNSIWNFKHSSYLNWDHTMVCMLDIIQTCALIHGGMQHIHANINRWIDMYLIPQLERQSKKGQKLPLNSNDIARLTAHYHIEVNDSFSGSSRILIISPDNNALQHLTLCKGHIVLNARLFAESVKGAVDSWLSDKEVPKSKKSTFLRYLSTIHPYKNFENQLISEQNSERITAHKTTYSAKRKHQSSTLDQSISKGNTRLLIISAILFALGIILGVIFMVFLS